MSEMEKTLSDDRGETFYRNLLEDAQSVASFGVRTGKLKESSLLEAISSIEGKGLSTPKSEDLVTLQVALSKAAAAIRPVTLADLKSGWNPFDRGSKFSARALVTRSVYVIVTFILMVTAYNSTQWVARAEAIVISQQENLREKLNQAISNIGEKFITPGGVSPLLNNFETNIIAQKAFQEELSKARNISEQIFETQLEFNDVLAKFYSFPNAILEGDFGFLFSDARRFNRISRALSSSPPPITDLDPCGSWIFEKDRLADSRESIYSTISNNYGSTLYIRCLVGADRTIGGISYGYVESELKYKIEAVNFWLLPAVFGMLGALVFQLRACLDSLRPDPNFGQAILRLFLGAFGGIAFGWLWKPVTGAPTLIPFALPLGVFSITFVIGYSIDILFSFLDRVVATVSGSIDKIGKDRLGGSGG